MIVVESWKQRAVGAIEWGTIGDTVGYVRTNRLTGFTERREPRPAQYDSLDSASSESSSFDNISRIVRIMSVTRAIAS